MRKTLAVMAALVMLFGVANVTFATQARIASLGKAWMYDGDFEDIYFYPNLIAQYPRMVVAELGTYPAMFQYYGSAAVTFANEEQTWGVAGLDINHAITGEDDFYEYLTWLNAATNAALHFHSDVPMFDNKWHLFYARNVGGLSAGLHIARAAGSYTFTESDTVCGYLQREFEGSSGIWDFNFGLGYSPMENVEANLGFSFKTYSFSAEENYSWPMATPAITPVNNTLESDGGSWMDMALQVMYGMTENFKLVPTAGLSMSSIGFKTTYSDTANHPEKGTVSSSEFWAGFGANYTPVENVRILGGIDFAYRSTTVEDSFVIGTPGDKETKYSEFLFPGFSAAVEADVVKWLTVRLGASKEIAKNTSTYSSAVDNYESETTNTTAEYNFGFGLAFKFNRLNIDVKVNDDQPFTTGYLMSGISGEPFTQVSATYKF
jgi:hypothetical protein